MFFYLAQVPGAVAKWLRQRIANPPSPVRIRPAPLFASRRIRRLRVLITGLRLQNLDELQPIALGIPGVNNAYRLSIQVFEFWVGYESDTLRLESGM